MGHDIVDKQIKHPSYGRIRLGRITGTKKLHGSHLKHGGFFNISIARASKSHDLGRDWHFAESELIEVSLSPMQFVELITTNGTGVPCTINHVKGEQMPPVPDEDMTESEAIREHFKDRMEKFTDSMESELEEAMEILDKKSVNKGDRAKMKELLNHVVRETSSNIPFFLKQFEESTEKIVTQAKGDVEAFVELVVREAGMEAIAKGNLPQLDMKHER